MYKKYFNIETKHKTLSRIRHDGRKNITTIKTNTEREKGWGGKRKRERERGGGKERNLLSNQYKGVWGRLGRNYAICYVAKNVLRHSSNDVTANMAPPTSPSLLTPSSLTYQPSYPHNAAHLTLVVLLILSSTWETRPRGSPASFPRLCVILECKKMSLLNGNPS